MIPRKQVYVVFAIAAMLWALLGNAQDTSDVHAIRIRKDSPCHFTTKVDSAIVGKTLKLGQFNLHGPVSKATAASIIDKTQFVMFEALDMKTVYMRCTNACVVQGLSLEKVVLQLDPRTMNLLLHLYYNPLRK